MSGILRPELILADDDFNFIVKKVKDTLGIVLAPHKRNMVYRRLAKRVKELGYDNFSMYCQKLENDGNEVIFLANAITTNLTSFFREEHHFEHLAELLKTKYKDADSLRIWSAGCSSGCEPYTIAMVVHEAGSANLIRNTKILATDIDTNMLDYGSEGIYPIEMLEKIPDEYHKYIETNNANFIVSPKLKNLVHFKRLNLQEKWPMQGSFDIIFCRNVVIYFSKDTQKVLFDRYADYIKDDGTLYIGHSENITGITNRFELCGRTIYRKVR